MAITLDGTNGVTTPDVEVSSGGSASAPAITVTGDTNTGIFFPAADTIAFAEGGAEAMRIDSSGNVGIGTTSPSVFGTGYTTVQIQGKSTYGAALRFVADGDTPDTNDAVLYHTGSAFYIRSNSTDPTIFYNNGAERARIDSSGVVLIGKTEDLVTTVGHNLNPSGYAAHIRSAGTCGVYNRLANDGNLVEFRQDSTTEGAISVSGSTVTYGGGHLARWGQLLDGTKDESIKKGTVLSNLNEMCVWVNKETDVPAENEQCNKIKISDVEGDANVAGVFVSWTYDEQYETNDLFVAMTGDMIIRIAQGVTVARGDLLMSAGNGTAKPQGDDIVRSKTIAKVTSTHVTCTYDDGSYCVPCVLMAC